MARLPSEWFAFDNTSTIPAVPAGLMRAKLCLSLVAFGQFCIVAMAQEQPATVISPSSGGSATYITHATVIDTETGNEIQDRTVIISGDRISDVRDSKGVKAPGGAKVVDGRGKYLIPGLWDMHVHRTEYESAYVKYLANGVTGGSALVLHARRIPL